MKYLFIGGTKFVGRQMVEDALDAGHEVHILQRGQTGQSLFPQVKKYFGDRGDIQNIIPSSATFDVVFDTCGYHPEVVRISCDFLKERTQLYVFISTGSVYSDFSEPGLNENSITSELDNIPSVDIKITSENYGPLKVKCEQEVLKSFGVNKSLILRPTIIVGPHDETQRFDFWINSIMTKRKVSIPNDSLAKIQFIDVRALSKFAIEALENNRFGIYNVIGPKNAMTLLEFLQTAKRIINPDIILEPSGDEEQQFPMYTNHPNWKGFFQIDGKKSYDAGLIDISVEDTIRNVAKALRKEINL